MRTLAAAALLLASAGASAIGVGTPVTYSSLLWGVSSVGVAPLTPCTRLILDATGDLTRSQTLTFAGSLNCPALNAGYTIWGAGYVGNDGTLNVTLSIAGQWTINCPRMVNFSGSCTITDPSGIQRGFSQLVFM